MSAVRPVLIRDGARAEDDWIHLADDAAPPASGKAIVSLARWRKEHDTLGASPLSVGVQIPNTEDVNTLWPELKDRPLIALEWPKWGDGRALSQARVLRERWGYHGELRAVGCVARDLLQGMQRCGVDAFELRPNENVEQCLRALKDFSVAYQRAADTLPNVWAARRARG
jgi:uncharacterized protein (DUF934 family)